MFATAWAVEAGRTTPPPARRAEGLARGHLELDVGESFPLRDDELAEEGIPKARKRGGQAIGPRLDDDHEFNQSICPHQGGRMAGARNLSQVARNSVNTRTSVPPS